MSHTDLVFLARGIVVQRDKIARIGCSLVAKAGVVPGGKHMVGITAAVPQGQRNVLHAAGRHRAYAPKRNATCLTVGVFYRMNDFQRVFRAKADPYAFFGSQPRIVPLLHEQTVLGHLNRNGLVIGIIVVRPFGCQPQAVSAAHAPSVRRRQIGHILRLLKEEIFTAPKGKIGDANPVIKRHADRDIALLGTEKTAKNGMLPFVSTHIA